MNLSLQPFIENDLVILRPLQADDFDELYTMASDPLIWQQHQNSDRYKSDNFKLFFEESLASNGALVIIDRSTNHIIGSSRFKLIDENEGVIEIGWSFLSRSYWGGQYNRGFKKLMVNHALKFAKYIVFYVHPKNFRSQKAMEKLGAIREVNSRNSWVLPESKGVTYVITSPLAD